MKDKHFFLFLILVGILFVLLGAALNSLAESKKEYSGSLPCYDKDGKIINGVTCTGEIPSEKIDLLETGMIISVLVGIMFFIMGLFGIFLLWMDKKWKKEGWS